MENRRAQLRQTYGFDWPEDLFEAFEACHALNPETPRHPLRPPFEVPGLPLNVRMVGPFDLLFAREVQAPDWPTDTALLHWRFRRDPAEFFTIARGDTDGYTWGYWLEDPAKPVISSYYTADAFEVAPDGVGFIEAARLAVEETYQAFVDQIPFDEEDHEKELTRHMLDWIPRMREILATFEAETRSEEGDAYVDRYMVPRRVSLSTVDAMGLAGLSPEVCFGAVTGPPQEVRNALVSLTGDESRHGERFDDVQDYLDAGQWGTALQLAKALWVEVDDAYKLALGEMMGEAYDALGRGLLARAIRAHGQFPALALVSVDGEHAELRTGVSDLRRPGRTRKTTRARKK